MIIESLAKTGAKYLVIQVRPVSDTGPMLHFQILAPNTKDKNRNYGFAFDIEAPQNIVGIIKSIIEE